ncbi:glutamate-1-semialdehyde 2,1-aminomutase [Sphingomonas ginsenosidimutans]|jgi:glutamate-1-semialdehyde 2,1-aminomutase|uniref:Glutamate-1-semialdehyde 2,1-aminomutase n=1 Tax=Sphingomonas ginsenosidimutans TaxID=862134 RepID=A0A2A4HX58_9SPHN|nr:aminotransferase class III-fold pyridoxal phosphate-dependent enzyme [Sphingomonas ginsenosidimutans]MEE2915870.1 aminotransferase class III-fold pyridoxal phosphate-dependent enzyme [Pseudomonadota bacterium]PCG08268.1 glutamate-1-semialdehyde 2,1-aminomutase [Sphingomonas ginsenosidimutans]
MQNSKLAAAITAIAAGTAAGIVAVAKARTRLRLSRAKHPSLGGHVRMAKRVAGQIPFYTHPEESFFRADGADDAVAARRRDGLQRLSVLFAQRFPKTLALTAETRTGLSDLQFTGRYRVPFPFSAVVREKLPSGAFLERSDGAWLVDLDGNRMIDLTGSYGVNLFGNDFYKATMREALETAEPLGGVLGAFHPVVADNVRRLRDLSGLDEVSFHMSGTEAVMQAVRLARYHTGRRRLVRFAGAYHGWWGDVQPGIGNPIPADNTLTLADMSERTLEVLATRKDIACVLVNPLQALHPNAGAPSDSQLVDSARRAGADLDAYAGWLRRLASVCRTNGIVLIMDEVFVGFRLAPGSVARRFGLQPDMITWGKTLGGGLPIGVLTGRAELMKRWRDDRPIDICFARGTFNSHAYVMAATNAFLRRLETPEIRALYDGLDDRWDSRAARLNAMLADAGLPVGVANLSTIWTVLYTRPSRYNWMLQYYLRAEGLALSWVGTGRLIFSLDIDEALFDEIARRFVAAARAMQADGWWDGPEATDKQLRRRALKEALRARLGR